MLCCPFGADPSGIPAAVRLKTGRRKDTDTHMYVCMYRGMPAAANQY